MKMHIVLAGFAWKIVGFTEVFKKFGIGIRHSWWSCSRIRRKGAVWTRAEDQPSRKL